MGKNDPTESVGSMSTSVSPFKGQKYGSLRKDALKKGELFVDLEFSANNKSLYFSKVDNDIIWKRPGELCKVPQFVVAGASCDDLNHGELGNTWFVSACSSLAQEPKLFQRVVVNVKDQEWTGNDLEYAGIFHFQFWRYGKYIDVVVDDQLPTKNNKLVFCHSNTRNEFWSALLEKAYAKMYGDYETLESGFTADALVDFTGGVAEKLLVSELGLSSEPKKMKFFDELKVSVENQSLVTVNVSCGKGESGQPGNNGLIKGHGYAITAIKDIKVDKGMRPAVGGAERLFLVRLLNPWNTQEWTGAWSDESAEWKALTLRDREKLGVKFQAEGEFWMAFDDFVSNFSNVDICHFVNTSVFSLKKTWNESFMYGEWISGAKGSNKDRAGGSEKHPTFLHNPQYGFDITADAGDTIMISLEQEDTTVGKQTGQSNNKIGFVIQKVEDNRKFRVHEKEDVVAVSEYLESRSIFLKATLPKGRYVIIPSTDEPSLAGKFLARMYTTSKAANKPLIKPCPQKSMCSAPFVYVTRVKVVKAEGLQIVNNPNAVLEPYVVVKCEGESCKGMWIKGTSDPEWNFKTIYYRKKPDLPITIEVYNHNKVKMADLLGIATIEELGSEEPKVFDFKLFGKGKKDGLIERPGKIFVELTTSEDLTAF